MTVSPPVRNLSGSGASWRALRRGPGVTTEGWQDKRGHLALRSVGCFCWFFLLRAHIATFGGNVRRKTMPLYLKDFLYIAGPRHVR